MLSGEQYVHFMSAEIDWWSIKKRETVITADSCQSIKASNLKVLPNKFMEEKQTSVLSFWMKSLKCFQRACVNLGQMTFTPHSTEGINVTHWNLKQCERGEKRKPWMHSVKRSIYRFHRLKLRALEKIRSGSAKWKILSERQVWNGMTSLFPAVRSSTRWKVSAVKGGHARSSCRAQVKQFPAVRISPWHFR